MADTREDLVLDPRRTAYLSMDLQRDIIADSNLAPSDPEVRARFDHVVARCQRALQIARDAGVRVLHVRIAFTEGYPEANPFTGLSRFMRAAGALLEGSPGVEFDPRVAPRARERIVTKHGVSAFVGTDLDEELRDAGVDTLVLAGLVTHYVVEGTARHASDLGYRAVVLTDACTSATVARHEMALTNLGPLATLSDIASFAEAVGAREPNDRA